MCSWEVWRQTCIFRGLPKLPLPLLKTIKIHPAGKICSSGTGEHPFSHHKHQQERPSYTNSHSCQGTCCPQRSSYSLTRLLLTSLLPSSSKILPLALSQTTSLFQTSPNSHLQRALPGSTPDSNYSSNEPPQAPRPSNMPASLTLLCLSQPSCS